MGITRGGGTPCLCTAHGSLLPSLSHHCIGVYMCVCLSVGPVDKSSHVKLMDEIPPVGGSLVNETSICKLPSWLSECIDISWSSYIQQECADVKLVYFTMPSRTGIILCHGWYYGSTLNLGSSSSGGELVVYTCNLYVMEPIMVQVCEL